MIDSDISIPFDENIDNANRDLSCSPLMLYYKITYLNVYKFTPQMNNIF